jgi:2-dehydropantoate 2-reductase
MVSASQAADKLNIAILGKGAIGAIIGQYLSTSPRLDVSLTYLVRGYQSELRSLGFRIKESIESQTWKPILAKLANSTDLESLTIDCLILPIKCYQVSEFCQQFQSSISPSTVLFLLQNGMGGAQTLRAHFPANPIFVGTTTDAGYIDSEFHCQQTAKGKLDVGWFDTCETKQNKAIVQLIENSHPNPVFHKQIEWPLYQKLTINAIINPLCALYDVRNGDLLNHMKEVKSLFEEVWLALLDITANNIEHHISKTRLFNTVVEVINLTQNNSCSMREDLKAGRQTEVDGILGFLIKSTANEELSSIEKLYQSIKAMENKESSI